ncbi:MAG: GNAT family N-acetyltransferase [Methylobacterium sp.]|uniref:GNAT family N-acetyltransferase n=1 Tax=Methylobacterium sp. TaxID=409 RepID=UPI0025FEF382|nr:GNAT family N-acetyltransferase [Methylobacterium sp.]MBX9930357.1 GNAT family N-acetyltransferase [Methylobacterium sp.]
MIPLVNAMATAPISVPARRSRGFEVAIATDWAAARIGWAAALADGRATPFQRLVVMEAWFEAMAAQPGIEPLIVTIRDAATGAAAASLALVRTTSGQVRTIGFADLGLIDYNAPILGPAAPQDRTGAASLWQALRRALPSADVIELRKMPATIGGQPNPFALLDALPCALSGNVVHTGDDWESYHRTLRKTVRKELERSWRVFTRHPEATFKPVSDPAERRRVLAAIEEQQPLRMQATGKSYVLDAPSAANFYRNLVDAPEDDQTVTLTALMAGDEVVAALLGLRDAQDYIMVRISNAEGEWSNASPGKLIIDRSMAYLHERGYRAFDFSIGDYDYKRRFGVEPTPLVDLVQPLGWRGVTTSVESRARNFVRRRPALRRFANTLLRR